MPRTTLQSLLCALLWPPVIFVLAAVSTHKGISNRGGIAAILFVLFVPSYVFLLRALQLQIRAFYARPQWRLMRTLLISLIICWLLLLVLYGMAEASFALNGGFSGD